MFFNSNKILRTKITNQAHKMMKLSQKFIEIFNLIKIKEFKEINLLKNNWKQKKAGKNYRNST